MPLMKMEHHLVLTGDIDGTRDFYRDVLGMRVGFRPPMNFPGHWLYVGGTPCIRIAEWETYTAHSRALGIPVSTKAGGTGPADHIAFNATDFEETVSHLNSRGIPFGQNAVPGIGLRQIYLRDPNGVSIELNFMPAVRPSL